MRCTISFLSAVVVIIVIGGLGLAILLTVQDSCPSTSFRCDEDDRCFDNSFRCDKIQHCPNGSDELPYRCEDLINLNQIYHQTINKTRAANNETNNKTLSPTEDSCYVKFPKDCICRYAYTVNCKNTNWTKIDWASFDNKTTKLRLYHVLENDWDEVNRIDLSKLKILLIEQNPKLQTFPLTFLKDKSNVNYLYLENNAFEYLHPRSFDKMKKLQNLMLQNNSIKEIFPSAFFGLSSLITLDLSHNAIDFNILFQFQGLPKLAFLLLNDNRIQKIGSNTFRQLEQITQLNLSSNRIESIHERAFRYNTKLEELYISGNFIHHFHPDVFNGLTRLIKLSFAENPIHKLSPALFSSARSLKSLDLQGLDLENIDLQIFSLLKLQFVHFKKFEYCQYAPRVPNCRPNTDGISSLENLLNGDKIRVVVWVIALSTLVGNVLVITSRWKSSKESIILDVFFKNLAVADFLMGVYLTVIGLKDIQSRGRFNTLAYDWYNSWECTLIGVMAMMSSEVSLLILTMMSLERYLVITAPFSYKKLTKKWTIASMGLLWGFVLILSVGPALMWKSAYFGTSGLCFNLYLHDPFATGWEYNCFVFVGLNSLCLICIAVFYGRLFWVVRETSSSTPVAVKDMELAIRFFFMVLTDFVCWAPLIGFKLFALKGFRIPGSVLAWMTIFVLPINSAINPMLYTFSTGKIRIKILENIFITRSISTTKNHRPNQESIEARLMTAEGTDDDSKINSSHDWRNKLSASSDQSDSFSVVGSKYFKSKRQDSATSNVSDSASGGGVIPF